MAGRKRQGISCYGIEAKSGDVVLVVRGRALAEIIQCATEGFLALTTDPQTVCSRQKMTARVFWDGTQESFGETVVRWLNELVYLFDSKRFLALRATLQVLESPWAVFSLEGETHDPLRHEQGLLVKAATYHGLSQKKNRDGLEIRVLLDL